MKLRAICIVVAVAAAAAAGQTAPTDAARTIHVPGTSTVVRLLEDAGEPRYAISRDGEPVGRERAVSRHIHLRYARFDPLEALPGVAPELRASPRSSVHLVQFHTVSLEEYRRQIVAMGGEIVRSIGGTTHIVRMPEHVARDVAALPYVRWVGHFHPAYRLSSEILSALVAGAPESLGEYSVEVFERGEPEQSAVAAVVRNRGGDVINLNPHGFRMTIRATPSTIVELAHRDEVHFIDPWGPGGLDVDVAKQLSGVAAGPNIAALGFTGAGVRGEVFDTGVDDHPDLRPILYHADPGGGGHATSVAGIVFGNGAGGGETGFAPGRDVVISALYTRVTQFGGPVARHQHTAELVDPNGPYRAVLQTSSVGGPRTSEYNTISAETDDYLFLHQLLSTQSMSNANLQPHARPQAWAKNILGIGGVIHNNTLNRLDDFSAGSTGPAADGRVKPDLIHVIDQVVTTAPGGGYVELGGTSASAAIVAGNAVLLFDLWHQGAFEGRGGGSTVFDSRPKMATAKAMLINSAYRYDWNIVGPNSNMTRMHQGWGMAYVGGLYELRDRMLIVDEEVLLRPFDEAMYHLVVAPNEPELRVTMTYVDPMGPTSALPHRINDLSLRVYSPSGEAYWGNNGLLDDNVSDPGGTSNTIDTVENVFVIAPEPGRWTIEVIADEILEDSHLETAAFDADFSLIATGGTYVFVCYADCDGNKTLDIFDFICFQDAFVARDPYADCTPDGLFNIWDFLCFQDEFAAGCP